MNAMKCLGMELIRIAVIGGLVFGAVPPGGAQEKTKAQEAAKKTDAAAQLPVTQAQTAKTVESAAPAAEKSSGGPQEGIKVHGDWTIVVLNEDGTIAARHQFKNSLSAAGDADKLLADLLAGNVSAGQWVIAFTAGNLCNASNFSGCSISQSGFASFANSKNLTVNVPTVGPDAKKLILNGSVKVTNAGTVDQVETRLTSCPGSVAPSSCVSSVTFGYSIPNTFTFRFLPTPTPVVANQTVDITVVISFS
jgi:hypothetical protein